MKTVVAPNTYVFTAAYENLGEEIYMVAGVPYTMADDIADKLLLTSDIKEVAVAPQADPAPVAPAEVETPATEITPQEQATPEPEPTA